VRRAGGRWRVPVGAEGVRAGVPSGSVAIERRPRGARASLECWVSALRRTARSSRAAPPTPARLLQADLTRWATETVRAVGWGGGSSGPNPGRVRTSAGSGSALRAAGAEWVSARTARKEASCDANGRSRLRGRGRQSQFGAQTTSRASVRLSAGTGRRARACRAHHAESRGVCIAMLHDSAEDGTVAPNRDMCWACTERVDSGGATSTRPRCPESVEIAASARERRLSE